LQTFWRGAGRSRSAAATGPQGQKIFDEVSKKAWQAWQAEQTMLINEKQLSLMDPEARKYLQDQMDKYLSGENYDRAEGFVPQQDD
jgi:Fe-S cluster biosynthesis and repair protein YggX